MSAQNSTKRCSTCRVWQPLSNFHRNGGTKDKRASNCKACVSVYNKAYREANKERAAEYNRRYREANAEELKMAAHEWYIANRASVIARAQAYKAQHPERYKKYMEKARAKHWLKRKLSEANRRAVKSRGSAPFHPCTDQQTLWDMYESQEGLCAYCETPLFGEFHIDHMMPLSRGGDHDWMNFALTCARCNLQKRDKTPTEFLEFAKK